MGAVGMISKLFRMERFSDGVSSSLAVLKALKKDARFARARRLRRRFGRRVFTPRGHSEWSIVPSVNITVTPKLRLGLLIVDLKPT